MADSMGADELRRLIQQLEKITGKKYKLQIDYGDPESVAQGMDDVEEKIRKAQRSARGLTGEFTNMRDSLTAVVSEMGKTFSATNKSKKAYRSLTSTVTELAQEEEGINSLGEKRLDTLKKRSQASLSEMQFAAKQLLQQKGINSLYDLSVDQRRELTQEEEALLRAHAQNFALESQAINLVEQRLRKEEAVTKQLGLTGAALSGLGSIMGSLGLGSLASEINDITSSLRDELRKELEDTKTVNISGPAAEKYKQLQANIEAQQAEIDKLKEKGDLTEAELNEIAEKEKAIDAVIHQQQSLVDSGQAMVDVQYESVGLMKQFGIAAKGAGKLLGVAFEKMLDPAAMMAAVVKAFLDVNKEAVNFQRLSGQNASAVAGLNGNISTTVDFLQTAVELTNRFGTSATNVFSPQQIADISEAKNLLGLSADQAGTLAINSKAAGTSIYGYQDGLVDSVNQYNAMNNSVVSHGVVLNDVLNTSEGIALSLGANPKALGRAAAAARNMGLELRKVDSIASSLMDFESSIEAELEAQLLTGKRINLAKARELALNNDLEGLANELNKQGASAAEFSKMNRIQQESLAKALGMSRDELGKMAQAELLREGATLKQQAAARGVSVEQMRQINIQEKMQKSLAKLAQSFAPMLDALIPLVELISLPIRLLAKGIGMLMNGAQRATAFLQKMIEPLDEGSTFFEKILYNFKSLLASLPKLIAGFGALFAIKLFTGFNPFSLWTKALGGFKNRLGNTLSSMSKGISGLFPKAAEKIQNLSDKLSSVGKSAAKTAADTAQQTATNTATNTAASSSTKGGGMTSKVSKINTSALLKGAAAMAVAAGAIYIFGKAVQELAKVEDYGKVAIGLGLFVATMGVSAVILNAFAPILYPAAAAMIAFGAGVALFGLGLKLATPAIEAFGNVISKVLAGVAGIINATANGITNIMNAVTMDKVLAMAALGPALLGVSAGLIGLSAASLFAIPGIATLGALSLMASPLSTLGNSLTVVAAGIAAVATALNNLETEKLSELKDLVMTTAVAAPMVAATGAITELISGIAGSSNNNQESDSNKALLEEIRLLRAAVEAGGDVYIDGNKAGQALVLATSKFS